MKMQRRLKHRASIQTNGTHNEDEEEKWQTGRKLRANVCGICKHFILFPFISWN